MNVEKFKKESHTCYVFVKGKRPDTIVTQNGQRMPMPFLSFISVPYSYEEMMSFSEWQRSAICQAEISKSGLVVSNIQMDFDMFFKDVSDVIEDYKDKTVFD